MIADKLLNWYDLNLRELPWRRTKDPYHIWISEIIFQQTQINQGLPYYNRFIKQFPDLKPLASSNLDQVLLLWEGLGYYSRAKNLFWTAQYVYHELGGIFPTDYKGLLALKGVGKYTAAAIASICYNEQVPAIDGNAYRVFSRYFGLKDDISNPKTYAVFYDKALDIMPKSRCGDFNQAIMELGATLCKPKSPDCPNCPLSFTCTAYNHFSPIDFPVKTHKTKVHEEEINYYFYYQNDNFIILQRPKTGIWQGLYEFPSQNIFSIAPIDKTTIKHILTHKKLTINIFICPLPALENIENLNLINLNQKSLFAFPKPLNDFLMKFYS